MAAEMSFDARRSRLLAALRSTLAEGVRLSPDDLAFIASAWDVSLPGDLPALLTAPEDWDAESVVALVFSADDRACGQLLAAIQAVAVAQEDVDWIVSELEKDPPRVTGLLPDGRPAFTLPMPQAGIRRYVESLRLTQRVPSGLYTTLPAALPAQRRTPILSRLRQSRICWDDPTPELLAAFCNNLGRADDAEALLTVLIDVLETAPPAMAESALAQRKRACFRAMTAADRFAESAGRHNMETLMMMGIRAPAISSAEARRQMNGIDRVSRALFGRAEVITPEALNVSQTAVDGAHRDTMPLVAETGRANFDDGD